MPVEQPTLEEMQTHRARCEALVNRINEQYGNWAPGNLRAQLYEDAYINISGPTGERHGHFILPVWARDSDEEWARKTRLLLAVAASMATAGEG